MMTHKDGAEAKSSLPLALRENLTPAFSAIQRIIRRARPARKISALFELGANLPGQLKLLRVLSHPAVAELRDRHPGLRVKYLHSNYLARSLCTRSRLTILTNHYQYLQSHFKQDPGASV